MMREELVNSTQNIQRCRVCGCTEPNACWDPVANHPCYWVMDDLCSACEVPQDVQRPPVFKCEDSLWQMLTDGSKTFDARRWNFSDDRIYRLSWGHGQHHEVWPKVGDIAPHLVWNPVEAEVCFQNKATAAVLTLQYKGMEFASWAPGWCFLILGNIVGIQEVYREPVL